MSSVKLKKYSCKNFHINVSDIQMSAVQKILNSKMFPRDSESLGFFIEPTIFKDYM